MSGLGEVLVGLAIAVGLVGFAIWLFFWAVDNGQYDDLDGPAHSILFDDEDPLHKAGVEQVEEQNRQDKPDA